MGRGIRSGNSTGDAAAVAGRSLADRTTESRQPSVSRVVAAVAVAVAASVVLAIAPAWIALPFGIRPVFDRACLFESDPGSGPDAVGVETVHWSLAPSRSCTPVGPLDIGTSGAAFDAAADRLATDGPYEGLSPLTAFNMGANSTRSSIHWSLITAFFAAIWLVPPAAALATGATRPLVRRWYRIGGLAALALGCFYIATALALRVLAQRLL